MTRRLGRKGEPLAPCGRPFFAANPVNKKYNSRYRNADNQNKLGGSLGRATCLVAMTLYGFDISLEAVSRMGSFHGFTSLAFI